MKMLLKNKKDSIKEYYQQMDIYTQNSVSKAMGI
jgi:hypothetical protein